MQISQDLFQASCEFMKGTETPVDKKNWAKRMGFSNNQISKLPMVMSSPLGESPESNVRRLGYMAYYSISDQQELNLR